MTQRDVERLPTGHLLLLTPSLFLQPPEPLLLPTPRLLLLLVLPTLVKVLHHHSHKHVQDKEGHDEQKRDEIQQHPGVVVHNGLVGNRKAMWSPQPDGEAISGAAHLGWTCTEFK